MINKSMIHERNIMTKQWINNICNCIHEKNNKYEITNKRFILTYINIIVLIVDWKNVKIHITNQV